MGKKKKQKQKRDMEEKDDKKEKWKKTYLGRGEGKKIEPGKKF